MGRLARFIRFYTDEDDGNGGGKFVLKTVTGTLLHILDALKKPAVEFSASLSPQQDLHGYDNPWPAGGGKNLLNPSNLEEGKFISSTATIASAIDLTSSSASNVYKKCAYVTSGTTYTLSCKKATTPSSTNARYGAICDDDNKTLENGILTWANLNTSVQITPTVTGWLWATVDNTSSEFQLEVGSSATTYAPYSNECPITGWTGANVTRTGVNVWDEEWELGGISNQTGKPWTATDRIRSKNYIRCSPNTAYYFVCPSTFSTIAFYDEHHVFISALSNISGNVSGTTPQNACFIKFNCAGAYGATYNNDISINYPSTDTSYHAYSGQTIPITFPSEAGTVYGCTLTNQGTDEWKLVVDRTKYTFTGDEVWTKYETGGKVTYNSGNRFLQDADANGIGLMSRYQFVKAAYISNQPNRSFCFFSSPRLSVCDDGYSDASTFALSMVGAEIVYTLAEPITYTLTGQQALQLLKGENNIWADGNGTLSLTYKAQA